MARIELSYDAEGRELRIDGYRSDGSRLGPPMFRKLEESESLDSAVTKIADALHQCKMLTEEGRQDFIDKAMAGARSKVLQ